MMLPIIRLELEGVRYHVVHALAQRNEEMEKAVAAGVDAALKEFDFAGEVRRQAEHALKEHVARAVTHAIVGILVDRDVQAAVRKAVEDALLTSRGKSE